MKERIRDGVKVADTLRENEARLNVERRKVSERRQAAMVKDRIWQSHLAFAREFACQQNSVSQALRNHDHAEAKKEQAKKKADTVRSGRQNNLEKRALVKRYMEHRRLMNQAEVSFKLNNVSMTSSSITIIRHYRVTKAKIDRFAIILKREIEKNYYGLLWKIVIFMGFACFTG